MEQKINGFDQEVDMRKLFEVPSDEPEINDRLGDMFSHRILTAEEEQMLGTYIQNGLRAEHELNVSIEGEINEERQSELSRLVQEGQEAKKIFVRHNLKLVRKISERYQDKFLDREDLVLEGVHGLIRAAEKFDPNRGFKFSTYATYWVRQAIVRSINDKSRTIRYPSQFADQDKAVYQAEQDLRDSGQPVTVEAVSALTYFDVQTVQKVLDRRASVTASLDQPVGDDGPMTLKELIPSDSRVESQVLAQMEYDEQISQLERALSSLSEKEREVVKLRYGLSAENEPLTFAAVGKRLGVTRERIRQIEQKALVKLREVLREPDDLGTHSFTTEHYEESIAV